MEFFYHNVYFEYLFFCVLWYGVSVDNSVEENSSKGMRAVKLCTNNILQFLSGGAG